MRRCTGLPWLLVAAVTVATTAISACSSSGPATSDRSAAPSSTSTPLTPAPSTPAPSTTGLPGPAVIDGTSIVIKGFTFQPADLRAKVGDTITVSNVDGTDHSLTAIDGSFDTGRFATGTRTFTVTKPGRFEFKCEVHSFMPPGSIQVSG